MRRILLFILTIMSISVKGQFTYPNLNVTNLIGIPQSASPSIGSSSSAIKYLIYNTTTSKVQVWNGTSWVDITAGLGSGTVTSFGKTDGYGITSSVANPTTTPNHTVAVDTTSGTGLVSKARQTALNASLVHLAGNETISGTKTFSSTVTLKGGIIVDNATVALRDFSGTGFKVSLTPPVTVVGSDKTINIRDQSGTMALTSDISIQPIAVKSADYTLTVSDYTIVTGTSSTTYTLPAASSVPVGKTFVIKNFSSGSITVATTGTELKWNPASFITPVASLTGTISGWMLQTDGTYWYLITGD